MEDKKKTLISSFTRQEVAKLLDKQIEYCSRSIDTSNMSEFTARRKVLETDRVKF